MPKMTKVSKMPKVKDFDHFIKKEAVPVIKYLAANLADTSVLHFKSHVPAIFHLSSVICHQSSVPPAALTPESSSYPDT